MIAVRRLPVLLAPLLLWGCAGVTTLDGQRLGMTSSEFRAYVERVFREQNQVTTELLFAIEDAQSNEQQGRLADLEEAILSACAGLNELATARRDGRSLGVFRESRMAREAPQCEAITLQVAAALEAL